MTEDARILQMMESDAEENGYYLCPDPELLEDLVAGIALNTERYGYGSCPCRIASGIETYDGDMMCPCEYRDADVDEFGMCYCGLFVSREIKDDPGRLVPIPERRPPEFQEAAAGSVVAGAVGHDDLEGSGKGAPPPMNHPQMSLWVSSSETQESASPSPPPPNGGGPRRGFLRVEKRNTYTVWRCKVCGYLCARERPPPMCPICKAKAERFEIFEFG